MVVVLHVVVQCSWRAGVSVSWGGRVRFVGWVLDSAVGGREDDKVVVVWISVG